MRIMVTGGAGFIGSHIVDQLTGVGHKVVVVDNLSTGKREHINPKASFFNQDIREKTLALIFKQEQISHVIHTAAQIDVNASFDDPFHDADTNILGTLNLLECCVKHQVRHFIFSSSAAVYGESQQLPVGEDAPFNPDSPYGVSKGVAEQYIKLYGRLYGLNYLIFRYSNVYGPRQCPKGECGVVANFLHIMANGGEERPIIFGDGEQIRDFIYVKDLALAHVLGVELQEKKTIRDIFNLSINRGTTINQLLQQIKQVTKRQVEPIFEKSRPDEIQKSILNNTKIKEYLYWKPHFTLKQGLKETFYAQRQEKVDLRFSI